jgi:cytochrome P450
MDTQTSFDQYLLTPEYLADPYRFYQRLRSEEPVYWSDTTHTWLLMRYSDVVAALHDSNLKTGGKPQAHLQHLPEVVQAELEPLQRHYQTWMSFVDPPDHTRLRALVSNAFTPRMLDDLRPRIQQIVDNLLEEAQEVRQMDVIADFAYPLPATVICEMLGLPPEDYRQFHEWSAGLVEFFGTGIPEVDTARRTQRSLLALSDYLRDVFAQRRQHPKKDLISALVGQEAGDSLNEDELFGMCVFLLAAGHETTVSLIGNGLLALLHHPEQMKKLQSDPSLIETAVEEFLRYDSPLQSLARVAKEDLEINGKQILKGQVVRPMLGSANRDPAQFPEPDRLDICRHPNRHVAFGFGIHYCLGAPLARIEGQIAINSFLQRMSHVQLAGESLEWRRNLSNRNPLSLPVVF